MRKKTMNATSAKSSAAAAAEKADFRVRSTAVAIVVD